jgi:hypothetical protein
MALEFAFIVAFTKQADGTTLQLKRGAALEAAGKFYDTSFVESYMRSPSHLVHARLAFLARRGERVHRASQRRLFGCQWTLG